MGVLLCCCVLCQLDRSDCCVVAKSHGLQLANNGSISSWSRSGGGGRGGHRELLLSCLNAFPPEIFQIKGDFEWNGDVELSGYPRVEEEAPHDHQQMIGEGEKGRRGIRCRRPMTSGTVVALDSAEVTQGGERKENVSRGAEEEESGK